MIAGVDADNAASLRLHERLGFTAVARLPEVARKFDRWLDLVFLGAACCRSGRRWRPAGRCGRRPADRQQRDEVVRERADRERVDDRADADRAAERPAAASTVTSSDVRTTRIEWPRAASPVISPSRGPGPRPAPM